VHYYIRQKKEFGKGFTLYKFLFYSGVCKNV